MFVSSKTLRGDRGRSDRLTEFIHMFLTQGTANGQQLLKPETVELMSTNQPRRE
jgi:hypothetical protein